MWTEGLFLMPQHLQLLDSYHERLLDQRLSQLGPHYWGVSELEIDADDLARGVFRLARCHAVMPDGLVVQIGPDQPLKGLTAMTGGQLFGGARSLEIYLAVPAADAGGVSADETTGGTRYLRDTRLIPDSFGEADEAEIDCVRPNLQILTNHDNRQNYVTIKIAELVVNESGRLSVSDHYVPPVTRLAAAPPLTDRMGRMVGALASKQKHLVSKYGDRVAAMVEFGAADIATFWYLHTINSWLPIFTHHTESGSVHPEQLYLGLASFAGQLSSFEATTDPLDLPRFRFLDLAGTFYPLFDRILSLLGSVVSARYKTIPLEQTQPGLFVGQVDDPQILRTHLLILTAGGDIDEEVLRDDLPRYLKVGSIDQIAQIVQSALPGVGARTDMSPPSAIPVRAHMLYLRLDKQGRYWEGVKQSGTIAIYQPVKPNRVKLELLAVEG
jgi:type VI secretion system protein ImpJ